MKLYLVRHGQALDAHENTLRPLSEKGKLDVQRTSDFLKNAKIKIEAVFSSRKTRAIETAEIFAAELMPTVKVEQIDGISPNDSAVKFLENIEFDSNDIMLVGHLPFLAHLTSLLLNQNENTVNILYKTSAVVCLEQKGAGGWKLIFSINPELI